MACCGAACPISADPRTPHLTRTRKAFIRDRTRTANRLHKVLEDAGLKLAAVARGILGASGRAMLEALTRGTTDPDALVELARGKLRKKLPALRQALAGRFRPHHAFLVSQLLVHIEFLDETIAAFTGASRRRERPVRRRRRTARHDPWDRSPKRRGAGRRAWCVDMRPFPTARHLASWAGLCPGNNESAGRHKSGRMRKGNHWLARP